MTLFFDLQALKVFRVRTIYLRDACDRVTGFRSEAIIALGFLPGHWQNIKSVKVMTSCRMSSLNPTRFQSGDDDVLRRMERGYTAERYRQEKC